MRAPRQTVLMWGAPPSRTPPRNNGSYSPPTPHSTHSSTHSANATAGDPLKSLAEMNSMNGECKWRQTPPSEQQITAPTSPRTKGQPQQHSHHQQQQQQQQHQQYPVTTSQYQARSSSRGCGRSCSGQHYWIRAFSSWPWPRGSGLRGMARSATPPPLPVLSLPPSPPRTTKARAPVSVTAASQVLE